MTPNVTFTNSKWVALVGTGSPTVPTGPALVNTTALNFVMKALSPLPKGVTVVGIPYIAGALASSVTSGASPIGTSTAKKARGNTSRGTSPIRGSGTSRESMGSHTFDFVKGVPSISLNSLVGTVLPIFASSLFTPT